MRLDLRIIFLEICCDVGANKNQDPEHSPKSNTIKPEIDKPAN